MRNRLTFLIAIVAIIGICILDLIGCQTLELENDQETVETLQNVFYEASYYLYDEEAEIYTVYDTKKSQIGYAFYAEGMGVGISSAEGFEKLPGPIIILVGLEDAETIKGIFVISHHESDMFWDLLVKNGYFDKFAGLKVEDSYYTRFNKLVDGKTGASLSSILILNTVRETSLEKFIPTASKKTEWQVILTPVVVIPFVLIPVVFIWYATIKQARAKRATHKEVSQ